MERLALDVGVGWCELVEDLFEDDPLAAGLDAVDAGILDLNKARAKRGESVITSDRKHQSASSKHGHEVEHATPRVWGDRAQKKKAEVAGTEEVKRTQHWIAGTTQSPPSHSTVTAQS